MHTPPTTVSHLPARAVTSGDSHFFGYYDKCPWSADGRFLLAGRVGFEGRRSTEADVMTIGVIDPATNAFRPIGETTAWNWQQGTMLQWLPNGEVLYNIRKADGTLGAEIVDPTTGQRRQLPRPVYCVSPNGREAISLDFHRLQTLRPGYGYPPAREIGAHNLAPDDVGLWRMDLATGEHRLIFSIAQAKAFQPLAAFENVAHWFNHATYNPDGSRFVFLHRRHTEPGVTHWQTRLLTIRPDGSDLYLLADHGMTSHFHWRDPQHLLAWAIHDDGRGARRAYWVMKDQTQSVQAIGEGVLTVDGHMTYSPDGQWLLTDEYPAPGRTDQPLLLYHLPTGERIEVGRFEAPLSGNWSEFRCDLHARWNHDGTQVCFDSAHSGRRQVYVMDVSSIVRR